jgi:hypothetical protein
MKIECPTCHNIGVLQQRGSSKRIQHYVGFQEGKRVYSYHKLEVNFGSNGSKLLEVKQPIIRPKMEIEAGGKGFEPLTLSLEG